jgi:serine/threonine-protein kinase
MTSPLAHALRDRYELERELGRGGMATVYLARDLRHDRPVALKLMHPELGATVGPERFLREIRTMARLDHPHILPVLDSGEAAGQLWYAMPWVRGESLRDRLRREVQLPVATAVEFARQLASALDCAHHEGVVHRDLKPENILLADGQVRIADFGVAKALSAAGEGQLTETGIALGTPAYMSPEQATGGTVDARSDVYALGCVVYEMLVGEPPYTGPTAQAILMRRLTDPVPSVRRTREVIPETIEWAITRALAKAPADRFGSAGEFVRALEWPQTDRITEVSPPSQRIGRDSHRAPLLIGAAVLLLGLGAALVWRSRSAAPGTHANLLAVAPFDVLDPKLELWREGLVDLLSRNLDGAGNLRVVPPTTVIRRWSGRGDQLSATELGRRTGAHLTVFGSLVPAGNDSARLRATLFDVTAGRVLAELELRDANTRIDRMSDSLSVRLLARLGQDRRIELTHIASLGSTSPAALKAFLQGEQWFRRGGWDSALAAYHAAVGLDSGFALAYWRLGRVLGWQHSGDDSLSKSYALKAGALNKGLAPRDSLLITVDSVLNGTGFTPTWTEYRRMVTTAREAVRRYPDDADAWHTLGEAYDHIGLGYGTSLDTALAAFDRAIALDSAYTPAYIHAMELASWAHGLEAAKRYATEYLRRAPDDVSAAGIRLAVDLANPTTTTPQDAARALRSASVNLRFKAWLAFYGAVDSGEVAARFARAMAVAPKGEDSWLPPAFRQLILSSALTYRGHLKEAAAAWSVESSWPPWLLTELCLLNRPLPAGGEAYLQGRLRARDLFHSGGGLPCWTAKGDSGSIGAFTRLADSLARGTADSTLRGWAEFAGANARAYLALAGRDTVEALARFNSLPDSLCFACFDKSITRLLLRSARGDYPAVRDDAGPWSMFPTGAHVIGRMERARALERLGDRERAAREYQYVVDAWRNADPELQPYVAEARSALQGLTQEPSR